MSPALAKQQPPESFLLDKVSTFLREREQAIGYRTLPFDCQWPTATNIMSLVEHRSPRGRNVTVHVEAASCLLG